MKTVSNAKVQSKDNVQILVNEAIKATTVCEEEIATTPPPKEISPKTSKASETTVTSTKSTVNISYTTPDHTPPSTQYCKCTNDDDDDDFSDEELRIMYKDSLHGLLDFAEKFAENKKKVLKRTGKQN